MVKEEDRQPYEGGGAGGKLCTICLGCKNMTHMTTRRLDAMHPLLSRKQRLPPIIEGAAIPGSWGSPIQTLVWSLRAPLNGLHWSSRKITPHLLLPATLWKKSKRIAFKKFLKKQLKELRPRWSLTTTRDYVICWRNTHRCWTVLQTMWDPRICRAFAPSWGPIRSFCWGKVQRSQGIAPTTL